MSTILNLPIAIARTVTAYISYLIAKRGLRIAIARVVADLSIYARRKGLDQFQTEVMARAYAAEVMNGTSDTVARLHALARIDRMAPKAWKGAMV